ncbi:InlB B-repeat-containing protein [Clostridium faecium]|uniref:InlB B-repeat-containing protein n=1 Tax=Clostridium faecium TaxID=2762223 RepID=A0ABR8YV26_9CLOT|nr:InlB B-repeat-containing protein [Clostridium faecium]MBD8048127.1 InlB B-repeat-containing protein [Clostridium faecium]
MKRILTLILAVVMIMAILPTTEVHAATGNLEEHKRILKSERTDGYALDYYSLDLDFYNRQLEGSSFVDEQAAIVNKIIAGTTSEYEKAQAVFDWLVQNMIYSSAGSSSERTKGLPLWQYGTCETFASTTSTFFRLAGFPVKQVGGSAFSYGSWGAHKWNHVYVGNRWVYVDTVWGDFDIPVEEWTMDHKLSAGFINPEWNGTLTVLDTSTHQEVMTIGPIPLGTPLGDIPELSSINLSIDLEGKYPIRLHDKFNSTYEAVWTKTHRVSFEIQLDNANKSLVPHVVDETDGNLNSFIIVPDGAKLPQVKLPVKSGYTFIGWRELFNDKAPIWNEDTDKVTDDISFVAVFKKGTVNYTVKYNTNGGTAVKDTTIKANTSIKKPADPKRTGYKFTGWYKDSALKEAWNFSTDLVRRNTTLYAGWESTNNAKPTASKVLVNGKAVEFDAYTINNNNYFKLRDLAQAVNNTEKNFEVTWDGKKNAINLISNKAYTPAGGELSKGDGKAKAATLSTSKIFKDGKEISLTAYTINGNNYFKLRDIAKAFDIGVTWDSKTNTIGIDTAISYVEE